MKKIKEIFYSIQGEGHNTGMPSVFVRFSGCNLKCPFCDEHHDSGIFMSDSGIVKEIKKYECKNVILTGGEPTLQVDANFVDMLHNEGFYVCIETNGTREIPENIDFITYSPKDFYCKNTKSSDTKSSVRKCDEVKVVFFNADMDYAIYDKIPAKWKYVQPCDFGNNDTNEKIIQDALKWLKSHPDWRLSIQLHKILNLK